MEEGYSKKVIISGQFVELYEYGVTQFKGKRGGSGRVGQANESDKAKNREITLRRARRMIRCLVNSNIGVHGDEIAKFLTLTFKEIITSLKDANYEFKKFRQRLEYRFQIRLAYLCVPEFQKRGAVHFHVIIFNLPYIDAKELAQIWEQGFIKVNKIENVTNVGAYISKYLSKDKIDARFEGEKCYFYSRSLQKPVTVENDEIVCEIMNSFDDTKCVYDVYFENEYVGKSRYRQYRLCSHDGVK